MNKVRIAHHLNCIKMCESDRAIEKRIETIFSEGNSNGWKESNQCPQCMRDFTFEEQNKQIINYCDKCKFKGEGK